jgi:hypothetical protein
MTHAFPDWHPTTNQNVLMLQRIQNKTSRFAFGKTSTHVLDSKILSVKDHLDNIDLLYFHKRIHHLIDCDIIDGVRTGRQIRGEPDGVYRLIPP